MHRIKKVKPIYDKFPIFKTLENDNELFMNVSIDTGGYGLIWNDKIDLSCEELWENGVIINK